jgi:type III secretion protein HrpB1
MSSNSPKYLDVSQNVVGGLIETVSLALSSAYPRVIGDPLDIECVIDAIEVLRPKLRELDLFWSLLHVSRGEWNDAVSELLPLIAARPNFAYAKSLLAYCLSSLGDSGWRRIVAELRQDGVDGYTLNLLQAIETRENVRCAMQAARAGRPFFFPEPVGAAANVSREDGSSVSAHEAAIPASAATHNSMYLRI